MAVATGVNRPASDPVQWLEMQLGLNRASLVTALDAKIRDMTK